MLSDLAKQMGSFELIAEHDIQNVNVRNAIPVQSCAMFVTLKRVLGRISAESTTSDDAERGRIGFLYPDMVLFLHGLQTSDCVWTAELKVYREQSSYEQVVRRAVVTQGLRTAWAFLESRLGRVPWSWEGAMSVSVHFWC